MKNFALILSLTIIFFIACNTDTKHTSDKKSHSSDMVESEHISITDSLFVDTNEYMYKQLLPIRKHIKQINAIEVWSYTKKIENSDAYKEETISYFQKNDTLEKIEVESYEVEQQSIVEYYAINKKLIFVYENTVKYNRPIYYDSTEMIKNNDTVVFDINKAEIIENLNYFINGELIRQINNQGDEAPFAQEYLKEEGKRLLNRFEGVKQ